MEGKCSSVLPEGLHLPAEDVELGHILPSELAAGIGGGCCGREVAMLQALGLEVCQDTSVGTALIRGISNGQKQRLSLGETASFAASNLRFLKKNQGWEWAFFPATQDILC